MIRKKRRASRCAARIASKDIRTFVPHAFEGGCTDCVMVVYLQHLLQPDEFTAQVADYLYSCLQGTCLEQVHGLRRTKLLRALKAGKDKAEILEIGKKLFDRVVRRHKGCKICTAFAVFFIAACIGCSQLPARKQFSVG